jgi:hypothetical protein
MTRESSWLNGALNHVVIQINEDKVIRGKFHLFISTLDTHNVRTRRLEGLNQASRKNRDKNPRPLERKQQIDQCSSRKIEHGGVGRQEDNARFSEGILYPDQHCAIKPKLQKTYLK